MIFACAFPIPTSIARVKSLVKVPRDVCVDIVPYESVHSGPKTPTIFRNLRHLELCSRANHLTTPPTCPKTSLHTSHRDLPNAPPNAPLPPTPDLRALLQRTPSLTPHLTTIDGSLNTVFSSSLLDLLPQAFSVVKSGATLNFAILKATCIANRSGSFTTEDSGRVVVASAGGIALVRTGSGCAGSKGMPQTAAPIVIRERVRLMGHVIPTCRLKKTLTAPIVLLDLKVLGKYTEELVDALTVRLAAESAGLGLRLRSGVLDKAFEGIGAVYSA